METVDEVEDECEDDDGKNQILEFEQLNHSRKNFWSAFESADFYFGFGCESSFKQVFDNVGIFI